VLLETIDKRSSTRIAAFFGSTAGGPTSTGRLVPVKSRFGQFMFDLDRAVALPDGLLGFPAARSFALVPLESDRLRPFQLMQVIEDEKLSFLVLAFDRDNPLIRAPDADAAARACGIDNHEFGVILIANLRRSPSGPKLSLNLRAPVMLDLNTRRAWQHILADEQYPIRHFL